MIRRKLKKLLIIILVMIITIINITANVSNATLNLDSVDETVRDSIIDLGETVQNIQNDPTSSQESKDTNIRAKIDDWLSQHKNYTVTDLKLITQQMPVDQVYGYEKLGTLMQKLDELYDLKEEDTSSPNIDIDDLENDVTDSVLELARNIKDRENNVVIKSFIEQWLNEHTYITDSGLEINYTEEDLENIARQMKQSETNSENIDLLNNLINQLDDLYNLDGANDADPFAAFIDGLAGLIFYPLKIIPALIGAVLLGIADATTWENLTLYRILFNKIELTKIDFFTSSSDATVSEIRDNVAIWYVGIRNVAAVLLSLILIYVGIRMAMSTVAEDKAKYKKMFIDWAVSLCLLFVLHYIMIFVINLNNSFVDLLSNAAKETNMDSVLGKLFLETFSLGFVDGIGSSICYMMLVGVTFIFFFSYIKRMITLAFLIIISPLITVTYSIDKMGDGKSQALNTWLKEFIYNILIQPFHCIIYLSLVSTVLNLVTEDKLGQGLINVFIAVYVIMFMFKAEDIIKKIFGFESESMGKTIASAAITSAIISKGSGLIGNAGSKNKKSKDSSEYRKRPRTTNSSGLEQSTGNIGGSGDNGQGNQGRNGQGSSGGNGQGDQGRNGQGSSGGNGQGNQGRSTQSGSNDNGNGQHNDEDLNNDNEKKAIRKHRVGKLIKGWARWNIAGGLRLAGLGLGLSTGDLSTGIAGSNLGATASKKINSTEALNSRKSEQKIQMSRIANAVDDYQDKYGYSNNQVLQNTQDWLDGISTPDRNDEEGLKLYQQMNSLKQSMKDAGMSNDDIREQLDTLIQNCLSGEQSRINR